MRKFALIFMVFAVFAAVLLPTTAQALLQPGLSVNVRDGHAVMDFVHQPNTAEYHFSVVLRNAWNRDMFVTCQFRIYTDDGSYPPAPGMWNFFGDAGFSTRLHPGTKVIDLVVKNNDWTLGTVSRWNVWKRGCFKGPNRTVNWN